MEALEDRRLLTTFTVTNLNDAGAGSLRAAVVAANTMAGADVIVFSTALLNTSTRTIGLTSGQLTITEAVTIQGPDQTSAGIVVSGTNNSRVFEVSPAASSVKFSFLTITQGAAGASNGGGGLFNQGANTLVDSVSFVGNSGRDGGAISNTGQGLQVHRSLLASNTATGFGGGGFFSTGTALISDSTISGNALTGMGGGGGGVVTSGSAAQLRISGSTISGNTAAVAVGGGVFNFSTNANAISIDNSTITGNIALGGGGIQSNAGTIHLTNLTIVGNTELQDISGAAGGLGRIGSSTVNSVNTIVAQNFSPGTEDDVNTGGINGTNTNNFIGGNPLLGPLQDNGGPTFTMLPLPGSPVIDAGVTAGSTPLDQRGFDRAVSETGNAVALVDQGAAEFFPTLTQPYLVGPGANQGNLGNRAFNAHTAPGVARFDIQSYPGFSGEVRVAMADLNGDGTQDLITAAGPSGGPHIRIRNGIDPANLLGEFFAYNTGFTGGVYVAAGDINGDSIPDIITGPGAGGGPHVRVFSGANFQPILELFPFGAFTGGVRVASGDINNDGRADIIVAAGPGGGPHVKIYNGMTVLTTSNDSSLISGNLGSFFPYGSFAGGVFVAAGDVNGDGVDDVITGAGEGGGPHVLVFTNTLPNPIGNFFAYGTGFAGGVRVGAVDLDGDGFDDIITGAGPGGGPHVRIVSGHLLSSLGVASDLVSYFAYSPAFAGGVYVAGSDPRPSAGSPLLFDPAGTSPLEPSMHVTDEVLADITSAAIERFAAVGLSASGLSRLQAASVEFADLGENLLGLTIGNRILIDADAAGFGYFIDATPQDDLEFLTATGQAIGADARDRVDLLTVILHELAHVLGASDQADDVDPHDILAARLAPGIRRTIRSEDLADLALAFPEPE